MCFVLLFLECGLVTEAHVLLIFLQDAPEYSAEDRPQCSSEEPPFSAVSVSVPIGTMWTEEKHRDAKKRLTANLEQP